MEGAAPDEMNLFASFHEGESEGEGSLLSVTHTAGHQVRVRSND